MDDNLDIELRDSNRSKVAGDFKATPLFHEQMAQRLKIPMPYYRTMQEKAPSLLATNVNHWLSDVKETRMVRTMGNSARAFLSDRYRPLDNYDLCNIILPQISKMECDVFSCEITDTKLYIKIVSKVIAAEFKKGDIVQAGLCISNSEVGCSSLRIEPLLYRLICSNGAIASDYTLKKYHVGKNNSNDFDGFSEFLTTETKQADDKAFWMKVRDVVSGTLNDVVFKNIVAKISKSSELDLTGNPKAIVSQICKANSFNDDDSDGILKHLIAGKDLSAFGLGNAITRYSQDIADYDKATDAERIGCSVMLLPPDKWNVLNNAVEAA